MSDHLFSAEEAGIEDEDFDEKDELEEGDEDLESDEPEDDELEGKDSDEGEKDTEGDEKDEDKEDDADADEPDVKATKVEDEPLAVQEPNSFVPRFQVDDGSINALEKQRAELVLKRDEVTKQWEDGDLDDVEYRKAMSAVEDDLVDARVQLGILKSQSKTNQDFAQQSWDATQEYFFAQEGNSKYLDNPGMAAAMNAYVIQLAKENPNKSGMWVLVNAKKEVDKLTGGVREVKEDKEDKKEFETKGKTVNKKTGKPDNVISLRDIPEDDGQDTSDEFSYIDALFESGKVEQAEAELAKLTPAKLDQYQGFA